MTHQPIYREYHPRWYRPRMSTYWWAGKWPYVRFILRELSSVFVAWFVIWLLLFVRSVARGPEAYRAFVDFSCQPLLIVVNVVTFLFITFHALTWFNVAPQAIVAHVGTKKVPPFFVAASHYAAWIVVSAAIAWLLLR